MAKPKPLGRYNLKGAWVPPEIGRPPPSLNVRTALVAVPDPNPDLHGSRTERIVTTVRVDILETELAHGRIDEAAYYAGRRVERVFERSKHYRSSGVWRTSGRVDCDTDRDSVSRALEIAQSIDADKRAIQAIVGAAGLKFLERVLGGGQSFKTVAEATLGAGERKVKAVGDRFRWMLGELSTGWDEGR